MAPKKFDDIRKQNSDLGNELTRVSGALSTQFDQRIANISKELGEKVEQGLNKEGGERSSWSQRLMGDVAEWRQRVEHVESLKLRFNEFRHKGGRRSRHRR